MPEQEYPEELIRKLSKTVLHAAEKGRGGLFDRLTEKNAQKIAELSERQPVFFERQEDAPQEILLEDKISELMSAEFFDDPAAWIESQPNILRENQAHMPSGEQIGELWAIPYDVSRVKEFELGQENSRVKVVSKRIDPSQLEEVALTRKAFEAGIPTPEVYGIVADKGNIYLLTQHIEARTMNDIRQEIHLKRPYLRHYPFTAKNDAEYEELMTIYLSDRRVDFPPKLQEQLKSIWREYSGDIAQNELLLHLAHADSYRIIMGYLGKVEREHNPVVIQEVVRALGYKSLTDLINEHTDIPKDTEYSWNSEAVKQMMRWNASTDLLFILDSKLQKEIKRRLEEFQQRWEAAIYSDLTGSDVVTEESRLEELCREKGIMHKDFAGRNVLVSWDFQINKARTEDGHPKLYLIDWEPKPKTPKDKQE